MLQKFKKPLLAALVILITFSAIAAPVAHAQEVEQSVGQGQWWFPRYNDFLDKVNQAPPNEIFGERYTHAQVSWIINSILNILVGPIAACADDPDFGACMQNQLNGTGDAGAILPLAALTDTMTHTKPASSVDYIASKMERIGIVDEAYAQTTTQAGFGFTNSLAIIQGVWTVARDAAYSLVILMILILGFMVMFRAQLSPRTVITIQSALPRIVIGLLLITFSYAIAGLLVDLTFVLQGVISGVFASSNLLDVSALTTFQQMNDVIGSVLALVLALLISFFGVVLAAAAGGSFALIMFGPISTSFLAGMGIILIVLISVIILVSLARIWWVMMRTYVVIILLVFVSPFVFLFGIIRDGINGLWFKQMVANLSVFLSVGLMILLANVMIFSTARSSDIFSNVFTGLETINFNINVYDIPVDEQIPPNAGVLPGFTAIGTVDLIGAIIALGLFISIPKLASSMRDWIASGRADFSPSHWSDAVGGSTGVNIASAPATNYMDKVRTGAKAAGVTPWEYAGSTSGRGRFIVGQMFESAARSVGRKR